MSCPDCFSGHIHHGHLNGHETTLHDLPIYITEPPEGIAPKGLIVVVPDAFGWATSNVRLVADVYARRTGCRVYVPDFMNGTAMGNWVMPVMRRILDEGGFWGWVVKPWLIAQALYAFVPFGYYNWPGSSYWKVAAFMDALRCEEGAELPVGAVGFCWGGYQITQLAQGALAKNCKPLVDAVFTGHPSALSVPGDIEKIKQPYSVAIGDIDFALGIKKVNQMKKILEERTDVESEVVIIPGALHGFAVRGDPDNEKEKEQADQAENQCVRWFAKHLV